MIILIGGASSTGKTVTAQRLLEKYHIPYLSIDHLKMGLIRGVESCPFTAEDSDEKIGKYLWPIIEGIIKTNIENEQHLIVEGCYLLPHLVAHLYEKYPEQITPFYLIFSEDYTKNYFNTKIKKYRCVIEHRQYEEERTMEEVMREHRQLKKACEQYNLPFFEIHNDYEKEVEEYILTLL